MNDNLNVFRGILDDKITFQLVAIAVAISFVNFAISWFAGLLTVAVLAGALAFSSLLLHNDDAKRKVQDVLTTVLGVTLKSSKQTPDEKIEVEHELDVAIESFFKRIVSTFIISWYSNITQDEAFSFFVKLQITKVVREIALRLRDADHPRALSNKLLPVIYSHFEILDRIIRNDNSLTDQIAAFIDNSNPVHPATFNRKSEVNYLRFLSKGLVRTMVARQNYECNVFDHLVQEILSCSVLLPLTDVISDPATINLLVILATNPRVQRPSANKPIDKKVVLLENFVKQFQMNLHEEDDDDDDQQIDANFLKDQEKLYSFMQHLKGKSNTDIDLLKFFLDVEHLNSELQKSSVICDPVKLSDLQQKSEKLLIFYQCHLHQENGTKRPEDLLEAHRQARQILEAKWRNDFYKSAEYFQLIYGDRECSNFAEAARSFDQADGAFHQPKFSSKFKNVISIRSGAVEGLEATEIPIWDALDHPLGNSAGYYNSVTIKLRKERGQDLDSFMQSFFHSIEQEADIGEDVAFTQTEEEAKRRHKKRLFKAPSEEKIFKNLFNVPEQLQPYQFTEVPQFKSSVDSAIYFLASILNVNDIILKVFTGIVRILPDADNIICALIRKFIDTIISPTIAAKLVTELEEKIFDPNPSVTSDDELNERRELAKARIESINKDLVKTLSFLQNPVLNKHLVYCLIDVIVVEIFPELRRHAKD